MKTSKIKRYKKIHYPELVIHNDIVEGKFNLTSMELKTLLAICLKIQNEDRGSNLVEYLKESDDLNIYYTAQEIGQIIGIKKNAFHHFERILDSLMKTVITIKHPDDEKGWIKLHFLNRAEYKDGIISIKPEKEMLPFYTRITKDYTSLELTTIMTFKSIYSLRIYILVRQYKNLKPLRQFKLDELRNILGIKTNYESIKDLRLNVLEPAKKEINLYLEGIDFDYELIKSGGKSFTDIKFIFNFSSIKKKLNLADHSFTIECFKSRNYGRDCDKNYGENRTCDYCFDNIKSKYS